MGKRILILVMVFGLPGVMKVNAQSDVGFPMETQSSFPKYMPNMLPPSPDAYSFTKYGNLPVGLATGTAQFSVPIYTIKAGSLSHDISLSYSSNGVKVDEAATRVGINWRLAAGAAITRNVRDLADDNPGVSRTFLSVPIIVDSGAVGSQEFYNYVRQAEYGSPPDYAPDEYSFSIGGYSGKFIKRQNGEFTIYNANGVKVENYSTGFLITLPNGDRYYFLEQEVTRQYTFPTSQFLSTIPSPEVTAWWLTKIVSPSRDSIVFNYQPILISVDSAVNILTGISQNFSTITDDFYYLNTSEYPLPVRRLFPSEMMGYGTVEPPPPGVVSLLQFTENHMSSLQSIQFPGGTVYFSYSSREDIYGEKKLDTIKVVRSGDNYLIARYALNYMYSYAAPGPFDTYFGPSYNVQNEYPTLRKRLFLKSVDLLSNNQTDTTKWRHEFVYNDINGLPPRLSFSQDRFGYFNGKVNTYFFPNDTFLDRFIGNNNFGGDRRYGFHHSKKGILEKVIYPTGGYTKIEYDPNKTEAEYSFKRQRDSITVAVDTSLYAEEMFLSDTISSYVNMILRISCDWASVPISTNNGHGDIEFEDQYYLLVEVIDDSTGLCSGDNCMFFAYPGDRYTDALFGSHVPGGVVRIRVTASKPSLKGRITLEKFKDIPDRSDTSGIAGIRVKSLTDYSSDGVFAAKRVFVYGNWGDSTHSSGDGINYNVNNGSELSMTRIIGAKIAAKFQRQDIDEYYSGYNTIHSNSILQNFQTDDNTVVYKKVIELFVSEDGATKNNGGTEYEFYFEKKKYPIPIRFTWGTGKVWDPWLYIPPGAYYSNNDFITGKPKATRHFTYADIHGTREILQEDRFYYSWQNAATDTFTLSKHVRPRDERAPAWHYFSDFDIYRYWTYFGFLRQDSVVSKSFTAYDSLTSTQHFFSYSTRNYLPTEIQMKNSKGEMQSIKRRYVASVPGFEPNHLVYNGMTEANMVTQLREESVLNDNNELLKQRITYREDKGLYLPDSIFSRRELQTEYLEGHYQKYDSTGNLLQAKGRDGVVVSYIWGYKKFYPVAKIVGRSYDDAVFESSINLSAVENPASESALQAELNKLRALPGALVTTYIYEPLVGVIRETDPNGRSTYYEYDNFNRLSVVRDNERNVLRRICYSLNGQPVLCGYGTEPAWEIVSSQCEKIDGVNTGNLLITERDMNPQSSTFNQTRSSTVSNPGICPDCDSSICSGIDKKCINGVCETGERICTSSIRINSTTWLLTFYYKWSDESVSETYQEYQVGNCVGPIDPM